MAIQRYLFFHIVFFNSPAFRGVLYVGMVGKQSVDAKLLGLQPVDWSRRHGNGGENRFPHFPT